MKTEFDRLLLDEALDASVAITVTGEVVYWGKGAETMFGYTSAEALGCQLNELVVPSNRHAEKPQMLPEVITKGAARLESVRHRKDGSVEYPKRRSS